MSDPVIKQKTQVETKKSLVLRARKNFIFPKFYASSVGNCPLSHRFLPATNLCGIIMDRIVVVVAMVVVVWSGLHSESVTNRTGAESLSFYYPCMAAVLFGYNVGSNDVETALGFFIQNHRIRALCGARCMGNAIGM